MLKKIDTKSMIQVQSAGSLVGLMPNIHKNRQGLQNIEDIEKAISHQELDNLIKKKGYNITLPDQMIFTKEEVKEIVAHIANIGRVSMDWVNSSTLVLENKSYKIPDFFRERIAKGFCFDPSKNIQMEFRYQDPAIYQSSDIFEFLNSIYKGLSYKNEGKQEYNPIEGFQFLGTSELKKYFHRQQYYSQWREEILVKCGCSFNSKSQQIFQKMKSNKQYIRLAGMSCCFFEIQTCYEALQQFPNDFIPTMKALLNIFEVLNVSISDMINLMNNFDENTSDLKTTRSELMKLTQLKSIIKEERVKQYSNFKDEERMTSLSTTMKYLINQFQDANYEDPYLQLIVAFFSKNHREFQDYLKNNSNLLFYDQLVLCVKYLDDQHLQEFVKQSNSLNQLIINGRRKDSINILQDYLDKTGDIQLVGVLAAHMFILQFDHGEDLALLFDQYRKILTQENLIEARVSLEIEIRDFQNKYNKTSKIFETIDKKTKRSINLQLKCECATQSDADKRICTNCLQIQPQCSVCDCAVEQQVGQYILCIKCLHGGHETHISEWFKTYKQCPHKDCICECDIND